LNIEAGETAIVDGGNISCGNLIVEYREVVYPAVEVTVTATIVVTDTPRSVTSEINATREGVVGGEDSVDVSITLFSDVVPGCDDVEPRTD